MCLEGGGCGAAALLGSGSAQTRLVSWRAASRKGNPTWNAARPPARSEGGTAARRGARVARCGETAPGRISGCNKLLLNGFDEKQFRS